MSGSITTSLYVHIPFCMARCTYCAFNVYIRRERSVPAYLEAVGAELRSLSRTAQQTARLPYIHTIYLGGGTPSLLDSEQITHLLALCRMAFPVDPKAEITVEINPDNERDTTYFARLREAGVNRLSVGMQSAKRDELRRFARLHDQAMVARTVEAARQAGHDNVSLDLIYGAPFQTLDSWRASLDAALSLEPDHLSLYALQVEDGTALAKLIARGTWPKPDDDLAADMYDLADEMLPSAGLCQYEISTWARPGYECRHNLQYWHNAPYLGVGAGAHGYAGGIRYQGVRDLDTYIARANIVTGAPLFPVTAAVEQYEKVDQQREMDETVMTALRLTQTGLDRAAFTARFGVSVEVAYAEAFAKLAPYNLLAIDTERIRLQPRARLISNQVLCHFMRET